MQGQIVRSAAVVSVGNVLSRVMGLVREMVISHLFGAGAMVSAYTAASIVPLRLYELLVGGMISSALVPTLSQYADKEKRAELWRVSSLLFTLGVLVLVGVVFLLELGAPWITRLLVGGFDAALQAETTRLLRLMLVGVLFLGLSGLATALCQSLQRFVLPAFTTVVFNAGIVGMALWLGDRWGVHSLALGVIVGALLQFLLQLGALRDWRFRPAFDFRHPVLRHILRLYLPVIVGMGATELGIVLDRNLASRVGEASISFMRFATTLIQFPLGLVSIAVATAILPTLARQAGQEEGNATFRATLAGGLRLVLLLTLPAVVGLFVLAEPAVALLFQHGEFGTADTAQTALALRFYLIGLTFAAIDQPLVFAFYACRDTLTPAVVGVLGVIFYLAVALPTVQSLGMVGLILANGAQLAGHALVMILLFRKKIGSLSGHGVGGTLFKSAVASAVMGAVVWGVKWGVQNLLPVSGRLGWALAVGGGGGAGVLCYLVMCLLLRMRDLTLLGRLAARLGMTTREG